MRKESVCFYALRIAYPEQLSYVVPIRAVPVHARIYRNVDRKAVLYRLFRLCLAAYRNRGLRAFELLHFGSRKRRKYERSCAAGDNFSRLV